MIPQIFSAYATDKVIARGDFSDLDYVGEYLVKYFMPKTTECVVAIFLDNNNSLLHIDEISEGDVSSTTINNRKLAELAFKYNATSFILAHNHPKGSPNPSQNDLAATVNILHTFEKLDITLREHIVVGGNQYKFVLKNLSNLAL